MRVIVTCGPSCEPIDQVRFLSNFSTGELGALLAAELKQQGCEVICLRSRLATHPMAHGMRTLPFSTNEELAEIFQKISKQEKVAAVFHAAALCDYRVEKVTTLDGTLLAVGKIPTEAGSLMMTLQPTLKVIAKLRSWFPSSLLIGWKYEIDGTREEACVKAQHQIQKYQLDASVANGRAFGAEFELMTAAGGRKNLESKLALTKCLVESMLQSKRRTETKIGR